MAEENERPRKYRAFHHAEHKSVDEEKQQIGDDAVAAARKPQSRRLQKMSRRAL